MITRVTGKNQITIPAKLARKLGIKPGSELEWSVGKEPKTIEVKVKPSVDERLLEIQESAAKYKLDAQAVLQDLQRMRLEDDPEYGPEVEAGK